MTRILSDLPDEDLKWLDQRAAELGRSRASVLRDAVATYKAQSQSTNNADWLVTSVPIAGALSQLVPGQIHLLVAQNGNTQTPSVELTNTLTGQ